MPIGTSIASRRLSGLSCLLLCCLVGAAQAKVRSLDPEQYQSRAINCDYPVRLTHDCSPWQGATRPIAFGNHRMSLAAGSDGRTIMLSQVRPGPDHNGFRFRAGTRGRLHERRSLRAIQCIGDVLEAQGIRLQHVEAVQQGRRSKFYLLKFSGNAYELLKQFTVLESEHWLPKRR